MPSFDLVDEPWIPCIMGADGSSAELGLLEVLGRAPDIREVVDASPVVTVALHRLLLAILHRNFGPRGVEEWRNLWSRGAWDPEVLAAYFRRWHTRFDLFDEHHPFYQAPSLEFRYERPITQLTHELASGGNPATLFDHTVEPALTPAQAARYVVAHQSFALGSLITFEQGQDRRRYGSADAAPLTKAAVAVVKGQTLFQTLMLNLHCYNAADAEPFEFDQDKDIPAWERGKEPEPVDRYPSGYLDLLTWQSRRIRVHPETDQSGHTMVRSVVIMKGEQFPDGWTSRQGETMVAFRRNPNAGPGQDPWPPLTFREERAVWRDSLVLFQSIQNQQARPKMLDWLNDLTSAGALVRSHTVPMDLYGLSTYQAKVLFWRHERLPLPLAYLEEKELVDALRVALELAEEVGRALVLSVRTLAKLAVAPDSDRAGARQPSARDVQLLAQSLAPTRTYWAQLEVPFKTVLVATAEDRTEDPDGSVRYGDHTLPGWAATLRRAAVTAFENTTRGLDGSVRSLKGIAQAEREFYGRVHVTLRAYVQ